MSTNDLISALISSSEKAANIARICRQDDHLLSLLVQEKKENEKNPRFNTDFKTLADVLVQEMIKQDIGSQFPSLDGHIYGEENNKFETNNGQVIIEMKSTSEETAELLFNIIGDKTASLTLAETLHGVNTNSLVCIDTDLPELPSNIGIWIDPIDSTAEYISGGSVMDKGFVVSGLPCVTVLLGVFDKDSGDPLVGVINQPFYSQETDGWNGRVIFGINYNGFQLSQPFVGPTGRKIIAVSSSEHEEIKSSLKQNGYEIIEIAGAGFKLLNIILGHVCAYVLSKPTSFLWDICGCHAILDSMNGGIIDFTKLTAIKYHGKEGESYCNSGGIIAFRNVEVKDDIIKILKS